MAMYNLALQQTANLIATLGTQRTILVEGHMGVGKSSLLKILGDMFPTHALCYFDATTKDLGDLFVPNIVGDAAEGREYVTFSPNEEFGIHLGKPVILMIDEMGKANPMVKQGLTRVILERTIGNRPLPEGSIIFATTNLGAENVGDMFAAHQLNRITRVKIRKPDAIQWIEWGFNNDIDPIILAWAKDYPQVFQTFEETSANDNPYIFHPSETRAAFVTPRSLEAASDIMKCRDKLDDDTLTAALMGTIGERGALDLMAYVKLADQLPSLESIKKTPETAVVPTSPAAMCMVVFRTLSTIESDWMDAWMAYHKRLDNEAQAVFANGARSSTYKKQPIVMRNKAFMQWARENAHLYTADV